jgi:hypothetical protein
MSENRGAGDGTHDFRQDKGLGIVDEHRLVAVAGKGAVFAGDLAPVIVCVPGDMFATARFSLKILCNAD